MPRTAIYYLDYQTARYRKRLMVLPARENAVIGNPRTLTDTPAWGADPADGVEHWIKLPAGIMKAGSSGEAGYDELPIGCPDPPSRTFKFDLQSCIGNSDWVEFAQYLLTPVLTAEGEYIAGGVTYTFDSLNVFSLLTDKGDSSLEIADFHTEYVGVQERKTEETFELVELTNRESLTKTVVKMVYEASTVHIILAAFQAIKPVAVADLMTYLMDSDYTTQTTDAAYLVWEGSGNVYGVRYGTDSRFAIPQQRFVWFAYADLWDAIGNLVETVVNAQIGAVMDVGFATADGYTDGIGPLGMLALYKRDLEDLTGAHTGDPAEDEAHFCGLVYFEGEPGEYVGGWLQEGFQSWETLWDYLKDATEGFGARLVPQHHSGTAGHFGAMTLLFEGILDAQRVSDVALSDAHGTLKPVIRKSLIAGAETDIARAGSGDVQNLALQEWGTMDDAKRTIPSTHHSNVLIGDVNDVYLLNSLTEDDWNTTFEGYNTLLIGKPTLPDSLLVYFTTPSWATEQLAVPYHHYVGLRTSDTTTRTDCMDALADDLPTPLVWTNPVAVLWNPLRLLLLDTHLTGGIPYAVTKAVAVIFSKWNQIGLPLSVPAAQAMLSDLGSIADIDLASLAGGLLDVAARDPFILAINAGEDSAELFLLAPGD